ncbi:hypothetical protein Tco_1569552 [Tanacetum coccineum]
MGKSVRMKIHKGMKEVCDKLKFCISTANTEGERWEKANLEHPEQPKEVNVHGEQEEKLEQSKKDDVQGEQKSDKKLEDAADDQENAAKNGGALVIHASEEKASDDEPLIKKLKVLIPTPTPLRTIFPEPTQISNSSQR